MDWRAILKHLQGLRVLSPRRSLGTPLTRASTSPGSSAGRRIVGPTQASRIAFSPARVLEKHGFSREGVTVLRTSEDY